METTEYKITDILDDRKYIFNRKELVDKFISENQDRILYMSYKNTKITTSYESRCVAGDSHIIYNGELLPIKCEELKIFIVDIYECILKYGIKYSPGCLKTKDNLYFVYKNEVSEKYEIKCVDQEYLKKYKGGLLYEFLK